MVLSGQTSAASKGAQESEPLVRLCATLHFFLGDGQVPRDSPSIPSKPPSTSKRASPYYFDYDYNGSGENGDTLSKKLDFLFAHEGIRYKRNNDSSPKAGNSYFLRLMMQPTSTPIASPEILQTLSRMGTKTSGAVLAPSFASPSFRTSPLFTSSLASSFSHSTAMPKPLSSIPGESLKTSHRPIILMFHRPVDQQQQPKNLLLYNSPESSPVSAAEMAETELSSEPMRFVKKNPFDKEGIRFKRFMSDSFGKATSDSSSETGFGYPFVNEGEPLSRYPTA